MCNSHALVIQCRRFGQMQTKLNLCSLHPFHLSSVRKDNFDFSLELKFIIKIYEKLS